MNDRLPLDREESIFASWLATLDNPTAAPHARNQALKHLSSMYMQARINEAGLARDLEASRKENGELRAYRQKVVALTMDSIPAPVVQAPGLKPALSLVPKAEPLDVGRLHSLECGCGRVYAANKLPIVCCGKTLSDPWAPGVA